MRLNPKCAQCMYEKQLEKNDNKEYLAQIKAALGISGVHTEVNA